MFVYHPVSPLVTRKEVNFRAESRIPDLVDLDLVTVSSQPTVRRQALTAPARLPDAPVWPPTSGSWRPRFTRPHALARRPTGASV